MERVHRSPIWGTAWLVSEGAGKLITSRPIHSIFPDVVSDLIDWSRGAWVIEVLKQHLWPCDVERVIQVPIGTLTSIDGSYWFFSNHGKFTVMSCYYYILGQALAANTSPSRSSNILSMKEWKWMWGLQTTPKKFELFYGTRVTTSFQLKSHWFIEIWEEIPSVRSVGWASTTSHPFFECESMVRVWREPPFALRLPSDHANFASWFRLLRSRMAEEEVALAGDIC